MLFQVLKTVENLGVSCVKNSEQYTKKLDAEISSLNFPQKAELVRTTHSSYTLYFLCCTYTAYILLKETFSKSSKRIFL